MTGSVKLRSVTTNLLFNPMVLMFDNNWQSICRVKGFENPKNAFPDLPQTLMSVYLCITKPGCRRVISQSSLISAVITAMTLTLSC